MKFNWEMTLFLLLIMEIMLLAAINHPMRNPAVLLLSTSDFIYIGIIALPLSLVIISGGIDISLGSTVGLCAVICGVLMKLGLPVSMVIPLTLLSGLFCGLLNAALIHYTGINPLVITLGTLYLYGGAALLLSGLAGATGYEGIDGFPDSFTAFSSQTLAGMPVPLLLFLLMALVFWLLAHKTRFGKQIFLSGQNPRAARYAALPVNRLSYAVYALLGLSCAIVGILLVSYFGSARSDLGRDLLMPALTAVVLGGVNIYGGSGSLAGTALAALLVGYLQQGLQMAGVANQISSALSGALLIMVVIGRSISLHREAVKMAWYRFRVRHGLLKPTGD